ncbi:MAG: 4Fe-4S binding protein [Oscillospiraceae bacterium]|jgi:epoxyqueuosine reductase QueG|nr:4Fe-4S binding protein [Oscillospiraceae bacterium]
MNYALNKTLIIVENLIESGAANAGVCPFSAVADRLTGYTAHRLPENPQTVISAVFPYNIGVNPKNMARYVCLPDYHVWVGSALIKASEKLRELFPGSYFVPFCDASPIPEVYAAALAGLGKIGRHGLLITQKYGSWVHIGELVTDMRINGESVSLTDNVCDGCGECVRACPAGVLTRRGCREDGHEKAAASAMPDKDKKSRCVSALTQKKGELSPEEKALLKKAQTVWGCDVCQNVCPRNRGATLATQKFENVITELTASTPLEGRAFAWRGKEVLERNLKISSTVG